MWRSGVFGPSLSGKTTLVKAICKEYQKRKMQCLILDPNLDSDWGELAIVTNNEEMFWKTIWQKQNCIVVVEESSETIKRNPDLIGIFTRLRHKQHKLIIVGHTGTALLPVMREQLDTLYLFLQTRKAAQVWADNFVDDRLLESANLKQYEFIKKERFQTPKKLRLTI